MARLRWIRVVESLNGAKIFTLRVLTNKHQLESTRGFLLTFGKTPNLLCTRLQFEPSIFIEVTQHDSQQGQKAAAFVYFDGVP